MINNDSEFFKAIRFIERLRLEYPNDQQLQSVADAIYCDVVLYDKITSEGRIGEWTIIAQGRRFWLLDPRPEDIFIEDIAYSLARIPRFNGQQSGTQQYSVAEHCIRGSYEIEEDLALHFLLHDGSEYVTGDMISPLKRIPEIKEPYKKIEFKIEHVIFNKFGLQWSQEISDKVKYIDNIMVAEEMRTFTCYRKSLGCSGLPRTKIKIDKNEKSPNLVEWIFLNRFEELIAEKGIDASVYLSK